MTDQTPSEETPAKAGKTVSMRTFFFLAVVGAVLDQISKFAVVRHFGVSPGSFTIPLVDPIVVLDDFFQIIYARNTGAAFSIFRDHPTALSVFSTAIAIGLVIYSLLLKPEEHILRLPLGIILAGAVGNLIDRFWLGYVVDFIDVHWKNQAHFATFNVADSMICVGMAWLILISLFGSAGEAESAQDLQST